MPNRKSSVHFQNWRLHVPNLKVYQRFLERFQAKAATQLLYDCYLNPDKLCCFKQHEHCPGDRKERQKVQEKKEQKENTDIKKEKVIK